MRRFLPLVLILTCAIFGFGEDHGRPAEPGSQGNGHDDHDDNGPVKAGFAIITPAPVTTGGSLVVFATFGLKHGNEVGQAGLLPPGLTTNAMMSVNSSGRLSRNLAVAIVNPDSKNANVTLTLRDDEGKQLATKTITVEGHHQMSQFLTELFSSESSVPADLTGTLAITSTSPVGLAGLRFRGLNFSTLPITNLSSVSSAVPVVSSGIGGTGAVLLPEFAAGGGWATEIVIVNTGTTSMTVRLDLFKQDGTALTTTMNGQTGSSFTNLSIPALGVLSLAPRDNKGDSDF